MGEIANKVFELEEKLERLERSSGFPESDLKLLWDARESDGDKALDILAAMLLEDDEMQWMEEDPWSTDTDAYYIAQERFREKIDEAKELVRRDRRRRMQV